MGEWIRSDMSAQSPFTYRCFDLVTFVPLDSMPFSSVSFGEQVNGVGSFKATLNITSPAVQGMNWERSTRPNMTFIVIDFLGTPIQGYEVITRTWQNETLTISGSTAGFWAQQRLQAIDYSVPDPTAIYWAANPADPTVIAAQILYDAQQASLAFPNLINNNIVSSANTTSAVNAAIGPGNVTSISVGYVAYPGASIPAGTTFVAINDPNEPPIPFVLASDYTSGASGTFHVETVFVPTQIPVSELIPANYLLGIGGSGYNGTYQGVQILINGSPPPNIAGGSVSAYLSSGSNVVKAIGFNAGVVVGSAIGDGVVHIPASTTVSAVVQTNASPSYPSIIYPVSGSNVMVVHCANAPIVGQMIVPVATGSGIPLATTVTSVTRTGSNVYSIHMSANATTSHPSGIAAVLSPYFTITMSANATGTITAAETVNYSVTTGTTPTPTGYWISTTLPKSQFQTVAQIINTLSQMGHNVGFDYSFDVAYIPNTTQPYLVMNIWYPRQGVSGSNVTLALTRAQVSTFSYTEDATQQQNGIIETASKTGGILTGSVQNYNLIGVNGYPVAEGVQSRQKVNDATMLAGMAAGDIALLQNPTATLSVSMPLELNALNGTGKTIGLGDFNLGDDFKFTVAPASLNESGFPVFGPTNDPRFPNGTVFEWRINQYVVTIADNGLSTVSFTAGIPPTDPTLGPPTPPPLS